MNIFALLRNTNGRASIDHRGSFGTGDSHRAKDSLTAQQSPKEGTEWLWETILKEASQSSRDEPILAGYLSARIIGHNSLEESLSYILASKLGRIELPPIQVRDLILDCFYADETIPCAIKHDLVAVYDRDPAIERFVDILLGMKGYHALQAYRVAHWLWKQKRHALAFYLQNRISEVFAVDIHPAAKIGYGILIDHATSVVIGETAEVANNVSLLHEVTLGGTGKDCGDRHPKLGEGVLVGAGAKILGNVRIGEGSKIGAGSVVLEDVPAHTTVAGVPAKVIGKGKTEQPAFNMDHRLPPCPETV